MDFCKIDFKKYAFFPVIELPKDYAIYDFSNYQTGQSLPIYGVGKYNEVRNNMYTAQQYSGERNIHVGIDIGAPVYTPVYAFYEGAVFLNQYNSKELDYGYTIITEHVLEGIVFYVLWGHLSKESIQHSFIGKKFKKGDVIAWLGDTTENGGWMPHLHFQISLIKPEVCDLPGVVSKENLAEALKIYPDPRCLLGPLY